MASTSTPHPLNDDLDELHGWLVAGLMRVALDILDIAAVIRDEKYQEAERLRLKAQVVWSAMLTMVPNDGEIPDTPVPREHGPRTTALPELRENIRATLERISLHLANMSLLLAGRCPEESASLQFKSEFVSSAILLRFWEAE